MQELPSEGCLPSEPITLRGTAATLLRRVIGSKQHRLPASAGLLGSNYARACSLLFLNSHPSLVGTYVNIGSSYILSFLFYLCLKYFHILSIPFLIINIYTTNNKLPIWRVIID